MFCANAIVEYARCVGATPAHEAVSRRYTHLRVAVGLGEEHGIGPTGERIDIRRFHKRVAVSVELRSQIVHQYIKHILGVSGWGCRPWWRGWWRHPPTVAADLAWIHRILDVNVARVEKTIHASRYVRSKVVAWKIPLPGGAVGTARGAQRAALVHARGVKRADARVAAHHEACVRQALAWAPIVGRGLDKTCQDK